MLQVQYTSDRESNSFLKLYVLKVHPLNPAIITWCNILAQILQSKQKKKPKARLSF